MILDINDEKEAAMQSADAKLSTTMGTADAKASGEFDIFRLQNEGERGWGRKKKGRMIG